MEPTKSTIGDHGKLVLEMYWAGEKQADILRRLETLGVKTSRQNLSVWIARRLARIQGRAPAGLPSPVQIPQEPVRQVQAQPVVAPQKMAAAPSAVPASGATPAGNPAAKLSPQIGRKDLGGFLDELVNEAMTKDAADNAGKSEAILLKK